MQVHIQMQADSPSEKKENTGENMLSQYFSVGSKYYEGGFEDPHGAMVFTVCQVFLQQLVRASQDVTGGGCARTRTQTL